MTIKDAETGDFIITTQDSRWDAGFGCLAKGTVLLCCINKTVVELNGGYVIDIYHVKDCECVLANMVSYSSDLAGTKIVAGTIFQ